MEITDILSGYWWWVVWGYCRARQAEWPWQGWAHLSSWPSLTFRPRSIRGSIKSTNNNPTFKVEGIQTENKEKDILFIRFIVNGDCSKKWYSRTFLVHAMKSSVSNFSTLQVTVCLVQWFHQAGHVAALWWWHHIWSFLFLPFLIISMIHEVDVRKNWAT